MSNYLKSIHSLVQELEQHPKIIIHSFQTFPPVRTSTVETIQKNLGHTLREDFKEFFLETNGLELAWSFSLHGSANDVSKHNFINRNNLNGFIQIPALKNIFSSAQLLLDDYCSDETIYLKKENETFKVFLKSTQQEYATITFDTFLKGLIQSKGLFKGRTAIFSSKNEDLPLVSLDESAMHYFFNQSDTKGAETTKLQTTLMQQHAAQSKTILQQELNAIQEAHHQFLANGGAGGRWSTYEVGGFVFGIYLGKSSKDGIQANLEKRNLSSIALDTCELQLPFATFCGMYGKHQDFSDSDLSYSLFTDANLGKAIFADTNLMNSDFSRANLSDVSFMNANLTGCDFENCDLTGADFRGANWKDAKFPGAILRDIKY